MKKKNEQQPAQETIPGATVAPTETVASPEITQQTSEWYRRPGSVEMVELESLTNDPRNARAHGTRSIQTIAAALMKFGQQKPIVARRDGVVIAGNGCLTAARAIGWARILVIWTGLEGAEAAKYAIADNRTAEISRWNKSVLRDELSTMSEQEQATLGFSDDELDLLMVGPEPPAEFAAHGADIATAYRCPNCQYEWSGAPKPKSGEEKPAARQDVKPRTERVVRAAKPSKPKRGPKWKNVGKRK